MPSARANSGPSSISCGVYSPSSSSTAPLCATRLVRRYSAARSSLSVAKSRSIFTLSITTIAGSSSMALRTISLTSGSSPLVPAFSRRSPRWRTSTFGPRAVGVEEGERRQVLDELGMRLGQGRVVHGLVLRGGVREADLLGQDRLPGPRWPGHHDHRSRLQAAAEDPVQVGEPGRQSLVMPSPRLLPSKSFSHRDQPFPVGHTRSGHDKLTVSEFWRYWSRFARSGPFTS